jgi:hypothetical protein
MPTTISSIIIALLPGLHPARCDKIRRARVHHIDQAGRMPRCVSESPGIGTHASSTSTFARAVPKWTCQPRGSFQLKPVPASYKIGVPGGTYGASALQRLDHPIEMNGAGANGSPDACHPRAGLPAPGRDETLRFAARTKSDSRPPRSTCSAACSQRMIGCRSVTLTETRLGRSNGHFDGGKLGKLRRSRVSRSGGVSRKIGFSREFSAALISSSADATGCRSPARCVRAVRGKVRMHR